MYILKFFILQLLVFFKHIILDLSSNVNYLIAFLAIISLIFKILHCERSSRLCFMNAHERSLTFIDVRRTWNVQKRHRDRLQLQMAKQAKSLRLKTKVKIKVFFNLNT